jgi:hypothetical protein
MAKSKARNPRPAYSPWHSFARALPFLKSAPVPFTVEVLSRAFNRDVASRLLSSLRTLQLIDEAGNPTPDLRTLVGSLETPLYQPNLQSLIRKNYPFLHGIKLESAEADDIYKAFCRYTGLDDTTLEKSMSFFVNLAHAAGVPLSPSLQVRVKMSNSSAELKARRKATGQPNRSSRASTRLQRFRGRRPPPAPRIKPKPAPAAKPSAIAQLLEKLPPLPPFNPEWSAEVQAQWFENYRQLLAATEETG